MITASDFYARPGEPIRPKLRALATFVLAQGRLTTGAGIRRHESSNGTALVADLRPDAFTGFFSCRLKDQKKIIVGQGFINGSIVPTINGQPIDGIDDGKQRAIPELTISGPPDENLRSYICVRASPLDPSSTSVNNGQPPSTFSYDIIHTADGSLLDGKADSDQRGHHAIAMLVWSDATTIQRVVRVSYFNLDHSYDAEAKQHVFR